MNIAEKSWDVSFDLLEQDNHLLSISGVLGKVEIEDCLSIVKTKVEQLSRAVLFIDASALQKFTWTYHNRIFKIVAKWFRNLHLTHVYIISPNGFIKMAVYFAQKLYPEIKYSVHSSLSEASKKHSDTIIPIKTINYKTSEIKNAIEGDLNSNLVIDGIEFSDENGNFVRTLLLKPRIVYSYYSGKCTGQNVLKVYNFLEEKLPKGNVGWFNVLDLSKVSLITRDARKVFREKNEWLEQRLEHKYYKVSKPIKALFNGMSLVDKEYYKNTTIIDNSIKVINELVFGIRNENEQKADSSQGEKIAKEQLLELSKEQVVDLLIDQQRQFHDYKNNVQHENEKLLEKVFSITWDEKFRPDAIDESEKPSEFYDLHQNLNRLQYEAAELIEELKFTNENLNQIVEDRTLQIKNKNSSIRSLLESYKSPIWLISTDYKVIDFNSNVYDLYKQSYSVELNKGLNILSQLSDEAIQFWQTKYKQVFDGKEITFNRNYKLNGENYFYEMQMFPVTLDDKIIGCGVLATDITDIENYQKTLEKKNEELEKLNEELDSFIYRSSHDMRAPIATLLGLLEMVKNEQDADKRQQCFDFMNDSINKLDGFIHEITMLTKNSKYEISHNVLHLEALVEEVLSELAYMPKYSMVKIQVLVDNLEQIVTDKFRLKTVLKNLIANAIKYSRNINDSYVRLTAKKEGRMVNVLIEDNGQGIPVNQQEKVFKMFHRANTTSKGSGLGLYIVKETTAKLKGTITLKSKENVGTAITLMLPIDNRV
ncbi:MAG: PAS domain-containing sensor histidine kinase [Bacteroidia bacterium]